MKYFKTLFKGAANQQKSMENEKDIHQAFSCRTSVTVGWQPQEKKKTK